MPEVRDKGPMGVLRAGWTAELGDYAIAGDWARGGKMFVAGRPDHNVSNDDMIEHIVDLVEQKAERLRAEREEAEVAAE